MAEYKQYRQCADCKKIYTRAPYICKRCGARLLEKRGFLFDTKIYRTDKCNLIIAKRTLFGWKVRKDET